MWFMRPVIVHTNVPESRAEVYAFLDVMANHERFCDHMLRDWVCSGPPTGIGARAHVTNVVGGRPEPVDIEVVGAVDGVQITERNVGAGGRRIGHGTYTLEDLPTGGTQIRFTYSWQQAPLGDRLLAPVARALLRRALARAMERLAYELERAGVRGAVA
jgi:hypothetical protein